MIIKSDTNEVHHLEEGFRLQSRQLTLVLRDCFFQDSTLFTPTVKIRTDRKLV